MIFWRTWVDSIGEGCEAIIVSNGMMFSLYQKRHIFRNWKYADMVGL